MKRYAALLILIICVGYGWAASSGIDYDSQDTWEGSCNMGSSQSPIDIDYAHKTVHYTSSFPDVGGDRNVSFDGTKYNMVGSTSIIYMPSNWPVGHTNGLQPLQLHLHWGEDSTHGAEHHLFGDQHAGEVHLVMRNLDQNDSESDDYYSVFGVFLDEVDDDSEDLVASVVTMMEGVANSPNDYEAITSFPLSTLYNQTNEVIYTYEGSLTTPTCTEHVFWHVFDTAILVPSSSMSTLRASNSNSKTNRDPQPLNDRKVTQRLLGQRFDDSEWDEQTNDSSGNPEDEMNEEEENEESMMDPDADGCEYDDDLNMYKCWYSTGSAPDFTPATTLLVLTTVAASRALF